jgi:hypothetical protein
MKDQKYDAPQAQRLSDAAQASGQQCHANGSGALRGCKNGEGAASCFENGNYADIGCSTGARANECASAGNGAV